MATGGITIDLSQFQPILKKFREMPEQLRIEIDAEIEEAAKDFAGKAQDKLATQLSANNNKKTGRLMGSIKWARLPGTTEMSWETFAQTNYAAYNEWGTITYVSVPPDLVDIAIKYKGTGKKKTGGMRPKHYFFSQRALVVPELIRNLENILEHTLDK